MCGVCHKVLSCRCGGGDGFRIPVHSDVDIAGPHAAGPKGQGVAVRVVGGGGAAADAAAAAAAAAGGGNG